MEMTYRCSCDPVPQIEARRGHPPNIHEAVEAYLGSLIAHDEPIPPPMRERFRP